MAGGPQRLGEHRVVEHGADRRGQRVDVAGLGEQGVDTVGGHVAVAVDAAGDDRRAGGHRLDQHDPEGLAVQRRGAEHRRPAEAGELLGVADPPEPGDPLVVAVLGAQARTVRSVAGDPQPRRRREGAERLEQHGQTLALLVAATEEDRRAGRRCRRGRRDAVDLDAVEEDVVLTGAQEPLDELQGVLGHHDLAFEPPGEPAQRTGQDPVAGVAPGGVERADDRRRVHQHRCHRRPRRARLVHVEHVEPLVVERPDRAQGSRGVRGERGDRAVGRRRQAVAERGDERFRGWPVARPEHASLVALAAQRPCQAEHLTLDATGNGEAVRAHQPDPHRPPGCRHAASP